MQQAQQSIKTLTGYTPDNLSDEILNSSQPLVLKNFVNQWPAVQAGKQSAHSLFSYLRQFANDETVIATLGDPNIQGRYFYNDEFTGFNFQPHKTPIKEYLLTLEQHLNDEAPPACYVFSSIIERSFPGFRTDNDLPIGHLNPLMSYFIGNPSLVAAHWDRPNNIACVIAGKRRFTLYPPEQLKNLYVGPMDLVPANQAICLVDPRNPDFEKYPKFKEALANAQVADMEPGDAILIPSMWWHQVESLSKVNMLVNYWWLTQPGFLADPEDALTHAILSIKDLSAEQRKIWANIFDHYVFNHDEDTVAHIPEAQRGRLAPLNDLTARQLRRLLINKLNR